MPCPVALEGSRDEAPSPWSVFARNDLPSFRLRSNLPMQNSLLTEFDRHLLAEGNHYGNYEKLGAHLVEVDGVKGTRFAV